MKNIFLKRKMILFHPESPGTRIVVYRNWLEQKTKSDTFATLRETIKYSRVTESGDDIRPDKYVVKSNEYGKETE